jgi:hypothetical protein
MSKSDLGSVFFWRLAHSSFRHSSDDQESKRALAVVRWVYQHRQELADNLSGPEYSFLAPILQAYEVYATCLTPETYKDQIDESGGKSWKILDEMHQEYLDVVPELAVYSEGDLAPCMRGIVGLSLQAGMEESWGNAKKILTSDPKIKVQGDEKMTRPEKAYSYLRTQLVGLSDKLAALDDQSSRDYQVVRDAELIKEKYIMKKSNEANDMSIPIGIPAYDQFFDPQRGHLFGLLGFAGHRKSTLGRTWVYNACAQGHKIAHYALEMGADDELSLYYLIHCRNKYGIKGFSKKLFNKGELSDQAEDLFYRSIESQVLKEDLPGEIFYRQRGLLNWFELSKDIDDLIETEGITMVFCDYLTLVDVPGGRGGTREAVDRMIQTVKPFCESRKILFVTPIQGNRDGLDRCVDNDGQWDPQGIDTYSGYFRACDGIVGVYSPKETPGQMILSGVKNRHDQYPDPLGVNVCEDTGYIFQ